MNIFKKSIGKIRLSFQIIFTALTNGYLKGFLTGNIYRGKTKGLCVPGLNCYSCPGALGACPIGAMQAVANSRDFSLSFYVAGFLMSVGALFGRLVCGFMCPFGLFQDLIHRIPIFKKIKRLPKEEILKKIKYGVLLIFVLVLPMTLKNVAGMGNPYYCKYICPSGTLMGGLPLLAKNPGLRESLGILFSWKLLILVGFTILSLKISRPFCRYICPLGAIYGFFNPVSIYRMDVNRTKCIDCGACSKACKLDIDPVENPNSMECIRCGDCISACPTDAIDGSFTRKDKNKIEN